MTSDLLHRVVFFYEASVSPAIKEMSRMGLVNERLREIRQIFNQGKFVTFTVQSLVFIRNQCIENKNTVYLTQSASFRDTNY